MKQIPISEKPLVIRTDFSNQSAWQKTRDAITMPYGEYDAGVEFIDNIEYKGITKEQLVQLIPESYDDSFIIIFDHHTATMPEFPLLIVDLFDEPGREFRAYPSHIFGIECNLTLSNVSFFELADFVDDDGIHIGYPITMEDVDSRMDKATELSILTSFPVNPPPKTLDIRQHIHYWITRLILKIYLRRLRK